MVRKIIWICFIVLLFLVFPIFSFSDDRVAIWVELEGEHKPFHTAKEFNHYKKFIDGSPYTDIICQVYRRGRSLFPSRYADDTLYQNAKKEGFDPLEYTIKKAHSQNKKVHAWINLLRVLDNKDAPILKTLGERAILEDSLGHNLSDYEDGKPPLTKCANCKIGTPGIWLEPNNKEVVKYLKFIVLELILNYPELDGVHFDMARSPITYPKYAVEKNIYGLGYSMEAVRDYYVELIKKGETNIVKKRYPSGSKWRKFRQSQVTNLVRDLSSLIHKVSPHMEVSVAVIPNYTLAKNKAYQDWKLWLKEGIVDKAFLMIYTKGVASFKKRMDASLGDGFYSSKLYMGIGAWLLLNKQQNFKDQVRLSMNSKASGVALFSYSNLRNKKGKKLIKILKSYLKEKKEKR